MKKWEAIAFICYLAAVLYLMIHYSLWWILALLLWGGK